MILDGLDLVQITQLRMLRRMKKTYLSFCRGTTLNVVFWA
jgi:hypothetical protein